MGVLGVGKVKGAPTSVRMRKTTSPSHRPANDSAAAMMLLATICTLFLLCVQLADCRPHPPYRLQCENNLVGLSREQLTILSKQLLFATDTANPSFSWTVAHSERGAIVTASRVLVAADGNLDAPLWDSGSVLGDAARVKYAGPALRSGTLYFWKVSWRDGEGRWSELSLETGHFMTGVLHAKEWDRAEWITAPSSITHAPCLSKRFAIQGSQLVSAVLYVSGLGFFKAYVNGVDLNSRSDPPIALTPGWTNYEVRVPYSVYNVTEELSISSNKVTVEIILGIGWRNTHDYPPKDPLPRPDAIPRVARAILNITYLNNSITSLVTDSTWSAEGTQFTYDSIYNGETFDGTTVKSARLSAVATQGPAGVMYLPPIQPMVERAVETPVNVYRLQSDKSKQIVDFGNNSVGVCQINVTDLKFGAAIVLHHAEVPMHPPYGPMDGSLYYDNLRSAKQSDTYVSIGSLSTYQPSFTYHGFRYVEVSGYPRDLTTSDIEKKLIGSNLELNGHLHTSSPLLNAIQENCVRGQRSNLMSVPTDCCQRDERLGWMGDAGLSSDSMALNFHTNAFHPHFAQLIADELDNGSLADIAPFYRYGTRPADPSWGAAFPQLLWVLYHYYGDLDTVRQFFPMLTQYLDFMTSQVERSGIGKLYGYYGDWVPPPPHLKVDISFTSAFSYLNNIKQAGEMAVAINDTVTARKYSQLFQVQSENFNKAFLNGTHYLNGLQVTYVLPLYLEIVPSEIKPQLVSAFINQLKGSDQAHITAGIIGAKFILPVLIRLKQHDLAIEIVQQTSYPSWGFMIHNQYEPATTVWELWNSLNGSADMDSRNHHMFSSVSGWMRTDMVGLQIPSGESGFKDIHFRPAHSLELSEASVSLRQPKPVRLSWQRSGGVRCGKVAEDRSILRPNLPRHDGLSLSCGDDGVMVKVSFASFGNPRGSCNYYQKGSCHAANSQEIVEKLCVGQTSCHVPSDAIFWGDPCPDDDSRWLAVAVQCGRALDGVVDYKYNRLSVEVEVPVGSQATVFLPAHGKSQLQVTEGEQVVWEGGRQVVWEGGRQVGELEGLQSWRWVREEDSLAMELLSGNYSFTVTGDPPEERKWVESVEGGWVSVECGVGRVVSTVDWASYGDGVLQWVGHEAEHQMGSCHTGCSQLAVERECVGKTRCRIPSNADFFGGSKCTNGRLILAYTCNQRP